MARNLHDVSPPEPLRPSDIEAEQQIIATVLQDGRSALEHLGIDVLNPAHFYRDWHQVIWRVILALEKRKDTDTGEPAAIALLPVCDELRRAKHEEAAGGLAYVSQVANLPVVEGLRDHAYLVIKAKHKRDFIDAAAAMMRDAHQASAEPADLARHYGDLLADQYDELADLAAFWRGKQLKKGVQRFPLESVTELLARPPVKPLVAGHLWQKSTAHVFGAPGSGKTTILEDICWCVSLGRSWQGHATHGGHVILVQNDSSAEATAEHLHGWLLRNPDVRPENLSRFHLVSVPVRLLQPDTLGAMLEEWPAALGGELPVLVVIDSLSVTAAPGTTTDNSDMARYAGLMRELAQKWGACVVVVNHVGWGETDRPRGASALVGDIDTVIRVELSSPGSKVGTMSCYRDRPSIGQWAWPYRIETVDLNGNREGRTAPVVVPSDAPAPEMELSDDEHAILRAYENDGSGMLWHAWLNAWKAQNASQCEVENGDESKLKNRFNYVLGKLERKGVIFNQKGGRESRYFLTPLGLRLKG